jgi:uncharacterized protein
MKDAAENVKTISVTQAIRDAETSVGQVSLADWLWLIDNQIAISTKDFESGLTQLLPEFSSAELITILAGEAATKTETEKLINWLNQQIPGVEVQQIPGDQKIWHFIIGVE